MSFRRPSLLVAACVFAAGCSPHAALRVAGPTQASRPAAVPKVPGSTGLNQAGIISDSANGLIANNAGTLSGSVLGPAAGIISNNGANVISNNGAGVISNNGAGYRLLQASGALAPVAGARVELVDVQGRAVSQAPITTGADGRFSFGRLKASGPLLFLRVTYQLADRPIAMAAAVAAPRAPGSGLAQVTPAATLVAAKAWALLTSGQRGEGEVAAEALADLAARLEPALTERAIAAALLLPAAGVVQTFNQVLGERPDLAKVAEAIAGTGFTDGATAGPAPGGPMARPAPSGGSGSGGTAPTPAPTLAPWAEIAYQVRRVAGSTTGGMTPGADRLGATFMRISGLVVTPAEAFIVADTDANQIRRLPAAGATQLIAGLADGSAGYDASTNATATRLNQPHGLAYDAVAGDVYICDTGNDRIRYLAGGVLTDLVGGGADAAAQVAVATNAQLSAPVGLARDADGNLFFTERNTSRVRRYDAVSGAVSTLATGPGNGPIALDEANGLIWVANGGVVTAISGINGASPVIAAASTFVCRAGAGTPQVTGLAYDGTGTLYIAQASFPGAGAPVDARILRLAVDAAGQPTADPVVIAGTGGQNAAPAAYGVPLTDTDGLTLLLANTNWCALTVGPDGRLHAGNSYPGQWGQVLHLTP
jgi:hypothetical protein